MSELYKHAQVFKQALKEDFGVDNKKEVTKEASFAQKVVPMISAAGKTIGAIATGVEAINSISKITKQLSAKSINLERLAESISKKYPGWPKDETLKYLHQLKINVPAIFNDPYTLEEALRRAFLYGGFDPQYLIQLKELYSKYSR
jgi:hypothetical protein